MTALDSLIALRAITRDRIAYRQAHGETLEAATADALGFVESLTTAIDSGMLEFVGWEAVAVAKAQATPETRQLVML